MDQERHDVVIAGAGMAGATLALALAQAGMKVAVVDPRVPDPRSGANSTAARRRWPMPASASGGRSASASRMARDAQRIETRAGRRRPWSGRRGRQAPRPPPCASSRDDAEGRAARANPWPGWSRTATCARC